MKCPCTGKIANGVHRGSRALGGTKTITCNAGFKVSGTATLNCVNGKWDSPVPQCIGELTWVGFHSGMIRYLFLLYLSVSTRGVIGQFCALFFTVLSAKYGSFLSRAPD